MSEHLPTIKAKDMVRILEKLGFTLIRQKGSHAFFYHPDSRKTVIPIHSGDLPKPVLKEILKQINLKEETFREMFCLFRREQGSLSKTEALPFMRSNQ